MKKLAVLFAVVLAMLVPQMRGQVTATVVDPDGTPWAYGKWTATLRAPHAPQGMAQGHVLPYTVSGYLDANGAMSAGLIVSTGLGTGAAWDFTLCPLATMQPLPCTDPVYKISIAITSTTQDISAQLHNALVAPRFTALPGTYGYADIEATRDVLVPGATYLNVQTGQRLFNGVQWLGSNGGGGGGGSGSGITAVTCASGCSATTTAGAVSITVTGGGSQQQTAAFTPTASPVAASYASPRVVTLSTITPGSPQIFYTLDGSQPTILSTLYTAPINVPVGNTTIRAIATAAGYSASGTLTASYVIDTMAGVSLGQNANFNGWRPYCTIGCSAAYTSIASNSVDATNDGYFHSAVANSTVFDASQVAIGSDIPYYILNSKTDPLVQWYPIRTQYEKDHPGSYDSESDHTLVPLKPGILGEGDLDITTCLVLNGNDVHAIIIDAGSHTAYEMYDVQTCNGLITVYSITVFNLDRPFEVQHPRGRTSGDVSGQSLFPGVLGIRAEDYKAGVVPHAIRWTMQLNSRGPSGYATLFTGMASHGGCNGSNCSNTRANIFGARYRLDPSVSDTLAPDGTAWTAQDKITITAAKTYGMVNADNGINMAAQGTADPYFGSWSNLRQLTANYWHVVTETGTQYAAQVIDESTNGGTSTVLNQTGIYDNATAGPVVTNSPVRPTVTSFAPSATSVSAGTPVTFTYAGTNITNAFIDNAPGATYGNSGTFTFTPVQTATYRLTVMGFNGWVTTDPQTVTVTGTAAAQPTFSPAANTYYINQTVALACSDPNGVPRYTTNGDTPNPLSSPYTTPIPVNSSQTIQAMCVAPNLLPSPLASAAYVISGASAPVGSPLASAGPFSGAIDVALTSSTAGAQIHYALNMTPTCSSTLYTAPVHIATSTYLESITCASGFNASTVNSSLYVISGTPLPLPAANLVLRLEAPQNTTAFTTWPAGAETTRTAAMNATVTPVFDASLPIPGYVVNLNGSTYGTLSSPFSCSTGCTVYAVYKLNSIGDGTLSTDEHMVGGPDNSLTYNVLANGYRQGWLKGNCCYLGYGSTTATTGWVDTRATYNSSTGDSTFLRNGAADGADNYLQTINANTTAAFANGYGEEAINGGLAALIVYQGVVDSATDAAVENYIHTEYGTH